MDTGTGTTVVPVLPARVVVVGADRLVTEASPLDDALGGAAVMLAGPLESVADGCWVRELELSARVETEAVLLVDAGTGTTVVSVLPARVEVMEDSVLVAEASLLDAEPESRDSVVIGIGKTTVPELLEIVVKAVAFVAWLSADVGKLLVTELVNAPSLAVSVLDCDWTVTLVPLLSADVLTVALSVPATPETVPVDETVADE